MNTGGHPPWWRGPQAEHAVRAAVVVTLVALAALGLSGRRGLEWSELADAPEASGVLQVVLGGVLAAMVLVGIRQLRRSLRNRPPVLDDDGQEVARHRAPWLFYVMAAVIVLLVLGGVGFALDAVVPDRTGGAPRAGSPADPGGPADPAGRLRPLLLVLAAALVLGLVLREVLRRAPAPRLPDEPPAPKEPAQRAALVAAVAAAEETLEEYDDTRAAIIAAYTAMERSLDRGLARSGGRRRPSDTPTELLDRVVTAGLVSRGAARELTELFREARFSRHPLPPSARSDARAALARVSDELGRTRA